MISHRNYLLYLNLVIGLLYAINLSAQKPSWTNYEDRVSMYPKSTYVVGFNSERGVSPSVSDQVQEELLEYARIQLVESINVTIKSIGTLNITNINAQTHEYFKKTSASYSKVNITGLQSETYYDKKKKEAFAIAYAHKPTLVASYKNQINKNKETIGRKVEAASKFHFKNDHQNALKNYFETLPLFREIEEAYTLIIALDGGSVPEIETAISEVNTYKYTVNDAIADIQKSEDLQINDLAFMMAKGYQLQTKKPKRPIKLANFTYQDSKMTSQFSKRWGMIFEKMLVDVADYPITTASSENYYADINPFKEAEETKKPLYMITGTFWEEGEKLRVISILREITTGKALASMEGAMALSKLSQNNIPIKPDNFEEAYSELKVFTKDDVAASQLIVESWTNHGDENLIYTEGETMQVFVKVNKPCYIRFIYHAADGSKVLLLDNYYIDASNVNKVYQIPEEFECTGPFGVETLQINAQNTKFSPLNLRRESGYAFITDNLEQVIAKTRGFKKKEKVLLAEKRLLITTMPN
ncbi:MAG: DUF4384 domain-containing protein [Bacteroidota bacterium]